MLEENTDPGSEVGKVSEWKGGEFCSSEGPDIVRSGLTCTWQE